MYISIFALIAGLFFTITPIVEISLGLVPLAPPQANNIFIILQFMPIIQTCKIVIDCLGLEP